MAAASDIPVLLFGESGTGKELAARLIHRLSARVGRAFVPVNCAAIPDHLFESALFGYHKGAFTGATTDHAGLLAEAHQGVLFLDEIGELNLDEQAKLLRVLEDGKYRPVGSAALKHADARLITATNRDLVEMVKTGRFRDDLFHRLHVLEITLPPLRDRKEEDLPVLIPHFLQQMGQAHPPKPLPQPILKQLYAYHWPGNVRELRNVLSRYLVTHELRFANLQPAPAAPASARRVPGGRHWSDAIADFEREMIIQALEQTQWHRANAAALLGMPLRTFRRKLKAYQILQPYQRKSSPKPPPKSGQN